jgi:hypothetical protein
VTTLEKKIDFVSIRANPLSIKSSFGPKTGVCFKFLFLSRFLWLPHFSRPLRQDQAARPEREADREEEEDLGQDGQPQSLLQ